MLNADPAACCPDAYYCPAGQATVCPRHHGFAACCVHPEAHTPMDREAWHLEQERQEQVLLWSMYRAGRRVLC